MTYDDLKRGLEIFEQYLDDKYITDNGYETVGFGEDSGKIPEELLKELDELGFFLDEETGVWSHYI